MHIVVRNTGEEYPKNLEWGKEDYWKDRLKEIWKNHYIKGIAPINNIDKVEIGDASYPINEIILTNGNSFYDELNSPKWVYKENSKRFNLGIPDALSDDLPIVKLNIETEKRK